MDFIKAKIIIRRGNLEQPITKVIGNLSLLFIKIYQQSYLVRVSTYYRC